MGYKLKLEDNKKKDVKEQSSWDDYDLIYYEYKNLKREIKYKKQEYENRYKANNKRLNKMKKEIRWNVVFTLVCIMLIVLATVLDKYGALNGSMIASVLYLFSHSGSYVMSVLIMLGIENTYLRTKEYMINTNRGISEKAIREKGYITIENEQRYCLTYINQAEEVVSTNLKPAEITEDVLDKLRLLSVHKSLGNGEKVRRLGLLDLFICSMIVVVIAIFKEMFVF